MPDVIPGAEAWSAEGGDVGVLLLHGYTGNPVSMRPLAESLAARGYAVELPRLPGHGTRWQDLDRTTWRDWAREAVAGFEVLKARTRAQVVVGLSVGATLSLYLAETRGDELSGAVVVNPLVWAHDRRAPFAPLIKLVVRSVAGFGNDIAKPGADQKAYDRNPAKAATSMLQLVKRVRRDLARVRTPLLVLTSREDHTVSTRNGDILLGGVSSTDIERIWLERSYHVATLDYDAEIIEDATAAFVKRVTE
jgi:carboxylesterase